MPRLEEKVLSAAGVHWLSRRGAARSKARAGFTQVAVVGR